MKRKSERVDPAQTSDTPKAPLAPAEDVFVDKEEDVTPQNAVSVASIDSRQDHEASGNEETAVAQDGEGAAFIEQTPKELPAESDAASETDGAADTSDDANGVQEEELVESVVTQEGEVPADTTADGETRRKGKKRKGKRRRRIDEVTLANDIRYRGPLSYRYLRVFAWLAIIGTQVALILSLGMRFDAKLMKFSGLVVFLQIFGTLSVPLFLMANFAVIINAKNGYQRLLATYAFMALLVFGAFMLLYQRYLLGIIKMMADGSEGTDAAATASTLFKSFSGKGYMAFNIFVDLFVCTLFTFFVNYTPKKVFVGKKLVLFRLLAILPVLYEVGSFVAKYLCVLHPELNVPVYVFPFLTTKAPLTFLTFIGLSFFIKNRERVFLHRGKSREEYQAFLKTNLNSLHFSISASVFLLVVAILDIILYFVVAAVIEKTSPLVIEGVVSGADLAQRLGFGQSFVLLLVIPFIMLFSYTRTYKPSSIDMIIPTVGMVGFVICYLEGFYQLVLRLPEIISKLGG